MSVEMKRIRHQQTPTFCIFLNFQETTVQNESQIVEKEQNIM